jgi:lysozyme
LQRSPRADAFVKGFEKRRLIGYLPTPNDKPTNGWGHTGPDVKLGEAWTPQHADEVYDSDAAKVDAQLAKQLYGIPTTQGQYDALFSFVFNLGIDALKKSTLLRLHKLGRYQAAADQFPKWDHQGRIELLGLLKRRKAERLIYLS